MLPEARYFSDEQFTEILLTAKAESTPSASIANALIIILYIAWLVLLALPSDCFSKRGWWSPKDD